LEYNQSSSDPLPPKEPPDTCPFSYLIVSDREMEWLSPLKSPVKVFISWSGEKSKAVASALRRWLPDVIQTIEPWMSRHDIDAGARWNTELSGQLEQTKFGIICVTRTNTGSPWLLFEAGALAKTLSGTFVCPYLIDLEPSEIPSGPLTQFQAKRANETETLELLNTINKALKDEALPDERVRRLYEKWWGDLNQQLNGLPSEQGAELRRSVPDMVEEILSTVRGLAREATSNQLRERLEAFRPSHFELSSTRAKLKSLAELANLFTPEDLARLSRLVPAEDWPLEVEHLHPTKGTFRIAAKKHQTDPTGEDRIAEDNPTAGGTEKEPEAD
jgi:hypothetical protein